MTTSFRTDALSRDAIASGAYSASFASLPPALVWSEERILGSLADTLAARPADGDIWVFAYGSLIWNPMFDHAERRRAALPGWRRSFSLRMVGSRATPAVPGRMLALVPGAATDGMALRMRPRHTEEALRTMWMREMITGAYLPTWGQVDLDDGRRVWALAFLADPQWALYERDDSVATVAPLIAAARGPYGSNADYVFRLAAELRALDVDDPYVAALAQAVRDCIDRGHP